ncbi:hypothetical protein MBLNU230_g1136t1 [Neophaeotheca triangularis]
MLTPQTFHDLLSTLPAQTLPLDGALATSLETRGHDLTHPLWSGKILQTAPSSIRTLHRDYYLSGAAVATTASYQTSVAGLGEHFGLDATAAVQLMGRSVRLAVAAREEARALLRAEGREARAMLVAGSVGPYGAVLGDGSEYHGRYGDEVGEEALRAFHRPRVRALLAAGADLLALETMPALAEVGALVGLLGEEEFEGVVAWVSCTLHPEGGGRIADGRLLAEVVELVGRCERVVAVGVNCCSQELALGALRGVREMAGARGLSLVCYPNSGEEWDAVGKVWRSPPGGEKGRGLSEERVRGFWEAGARLIGGCCRTGPGDVEVIRETLGKIHGGS